MKDSVKTELAAHIFDLIEDEILTNENRDDWHQLAFNEDFYIIGYWKASQWLEKHGIDAFEAIRAVKDYERENFGELNTSVNSESIVNMLVYMYGKELLSELNAESVEELREKCDSLTA